MKKKIKVREHHGNFNKYTFDKDLFMEEIKSKEPGAIVNWSALARKYEVKIEDRFPKNGGQILYENAKSKGINVYQFNPHTRLSGRDYLRRVRRSIKRIGRLID